MLNFPHFNQLRHQDLWKKNIKKLSIMIEDIFLYNISKITMVSFLEKVRFDF